MNSELEILKIIWDNGGETSSKLISQRTGFGIGYVDYLCKCLLQKGYLRVKGGRPNWYQIMPKGKKELVKRKIIKLKKLRKIKDLEKIVYYFPKKLKMRLSKRELQEIKPKKKLIQADEEKLSFGKQIQKVVSFLKGRLK